MNAALLVPGLEAFADILTAAVRGLSDADARWRPPSGNWSVVEIVNHLVDEEVEDFRQRLELTLRDPSAPWPPNDPVAWARDRKYNERGLGESVGRFVQERRASLTWLRGLGPQNWSKVHTHPALGSLSAGDLLGSWAAHDWLHLRQIAKRRYELATRDAAGYSVAYAGQWGS